ncbi:MAG: SPFH domain-containing protein [Coriobacteriia bacterium]|nr:SPFH domain-containing protein [Coriobacteriia bacterium]
MESVLGVLSTIIWIVVAIVVLIVVIIVFKLRYKIAKSNQALVISGGNKRRKKVGAQGPSVLVSGGAFISPFKRHEFFSLAVLTVISDDRETQTKTVVPVVVKWTAQLKPDTETEGALAKAVMGFIGKSEMDIKESLQQTLEGEIRAVVATLTPEEVIEGREKFKSDIEENVKERMAELGFKLISLNITEVKDNNDHYNNLAAKDREEKRRIAENLRAEEQKSIDETAATTSQVSESARIAKDMTVAEKNRDLKLKQAGFREETDKADKVAEFAGQLEEQDKLKDLASKEGEVAVEREKQNRRAAEARRDVETTLAETEKQKAVINAEAAKAKSEIDADAQAAIAEKRAAGEAEAAKRRAHGDAEARIERAKGEADAVRAAADAEAEKIRKTRSANAEGIEAEGRAEAEAIRQKGLAEAEAERAKAEALAAQEGVNLQVTLAEIESQTRIKVSTAIATAVAEVGTNATIIDMGAGNGITEGDLLSRLLGGLPETLAKLDVKSAALNGQPFSSTLNDLIRSVTNTPENLAGAAVTGVAADKALNKPARTPRVGALAASDEPTAVDAASLDAGTAANLTVPAVTPEDEPIEDSAELIVEIIPETVEPVTAPLEEAPKGSDWQPPFREGSGARKADKPKESEKPKEVEVPEEVVEVADAIEAADAVVPSAEMLQAVQSIAKINEMDQIQAWELAQVCEVIKDAGLQVDKDVYTAAYNAVDVIKTIHRSGEKVDVKHVAKAILDLDEGASSSDILKRVAELTKKARASKKS